MLLSGAIFRGSCLQLEPCPGLRRGCRLVRHATRLQLMWPVVVWLVVESGEGGSWRSPSVIVIVQLWLTNTSHLDIQHTRLPVKGYSHCDTVAIVFFNFFSSSFSSYNSPFSPLLGVHFLPSSFIILSFFSSFFVIAFSSSFCFVVFSFSSFLMLC